MSGQIEQFGDVWKVWAVYPTQEEAEKAAKKLPKKFRGKHKNFVEVTA